MSCRILLLLSIAFLSPLWAAEQESDEQKKEISHYNTTFALAYRQRLDDFAGLILPRELVEIKIAGFIATPPFSPEIAAIRELNRKLRFAVQMEDLAHVQAALDSGANPSAGICRASDIKEGTQILKLLLERKASPNYKKQPLYRAALSNNSDAIKMLLDYGADPNLQLFGNHTISESIAKLTRLSEKIKQLVKEAPYKRKDLSRYATTFVLAYRRRLAGFAGLKLPREMVEIEIAQHIAAPPYPEQEAAELIEALDKWIGRSRFYPRSLEILR